LQHAGNYSAPDAQDEHHDHEQVPDREQQVLNLVAQGYSSQQIAKRIVVSVKTVETYRDRIADKLGLRTRSEVVRYAIRMGLLDAESLES